MARLILMRHGEAQWRAPTDAERPLTDHGVRDNLRVLGQILGSYQPQGLVSSPYIRARQTLQPFCERLQLTAQHTLALVPEASVAVASAWLQQQLEAQDCVLVVSHMPLLGSLVTHWVEADNVATFPFATSMAVVLEAEWWEPGCVQLCRVIQP